MRIEVSVPGIRKGARETARADNTRGAQARSTARSRTADLRPANRFVAVRAGDRHRGRRVCRHGAPGQHRNDQEQNHPPPPVSQQQAAAVMWCQTAARCSVPADCTA